MITPALKGPDKTIVIIIKDKKALIRIIAFPLSF